MTTKIEEVIQFTSTVEAQGFVPKATAQNRRTAVTSLFSILEEDQQTVEYGMENMPTIRGRFMNLHPEMRGESVDTYVSRARSALIDFVEWKADRSAWERKITAKASRGSGEAEKPRKAEKRSTTADSAEQIKVAPDAQPSSTNGRKVSFPLPSGEEFEAIIPRAGLTMEELRRIGMFLAAYTKDWQPPQSQGGSGFGALSDNSH